MKQFTFKPWLMALFIAAICLCTVLPGLHVRASEFSPLEDVSGCRFNGEPSEKSYAGIYNYVEGGLHGRAFIYFGISNVPSSDFKVRVQLTDKANPYSIWLNTDETTSDFIDGGAWLPEDAISTIGTNEYSLHFELRSRSEAEIGYTVSVYASDNLSKPLITSSEKTVVYINSDNYPRVGNLPRLSGELDKELPLSFSIQPNYLLGKPAKVRIHFNLSSGNYENLSVTGDGWARSEFTNVYEFTTPNLQASQFTLSVIANAAVSGSYSVGLYDGDDYNLTGSSDAVVQIPLNLSETDKQALIALRDANEMSNDLYNFIEKGIYLQDTEYYGSSQNVGVKWNSESPGRVEMFFIKDDQSRAVTSLNLKPLTALKEIYIRGTNLSKLDLSRLTLRELNLWDTKLKWGDVILPSWDESYHNLNGDTWIQIGTPLNDYNSVAANGTEIDLSEYAVINGVSSTFTWYKNTTDYEYEQTTPMDSTGAGKFILSGKPGEQFYCSIRNANYGNWTIHTSYVKIQRSASDFNAQDTLGLRKLANDNPNVAVLKEFVDSKGWEIDNWNNWQDQVRTQWDSNNRLTHLCIELDWGQDPDTISTLDLSAFTELKYFECERWLNIKELDLTNNTKLEHLHLFSNNLQRIDASMCTNLQVFKFATEDRREDSNAYDKCSLSSLSLPSSLKLLRIEHAHIGSFDFGQFPNLVSLHIGNCQALQPLNLNQLKKLETVELPLTTQFGDWIKTLPTTVTALWIQDTEYAMPDATLLGRLKQFGVPKGITQLDLSLMPKLEVIGWEGNDIRYSTVKNWRKELEVAVVNRSSLNSSAWWAVGSNIQLQAPRPDSWHFMNGDTIDLSSEAVINGVKSTFLWVNTKYNTEETEALQEVPGKPGVFVLNSKEEKYGSYRCLIMNEQFCDITPINMSRGWRMETDWIRVNTEVPVTFHEGDVQALGRLVNNANNPELNEWWSSNAWQTGDYHAQTMWNNENPRRLTGLWINTSVGTSADLSAFDKLQQLSLSYDNRELTEVKLPTETQNLRELRLEDNQALTSLIVAPYSNLTHLNVKNTGLTVCDVSQNKQLTELFMQWTKIQSVEETAPEIAKQLTSYGASDVTKSIDLDSFPALKQFYPSLYMRYSDVKNPRQMDSLYYKVQTYYYCGNGVYHPGYTPIGKTFDLTEVMAKDGVTSTPAWEMINYDTDETIRLDAQGTSWLLNEQQVEPENVVVATVYNSLFPNWQLRYQTWAYTTDGDVNLDRKVNVQDVTGMVSYMLDQWPWEKLQFGWAESNTNHDSNYGDAADLVGIVNIILNEPITKGEALRAAYVPQVEMSLDAQNMLHIDAESPIAALYMEFAGATQELPLLNQAARLNQSCSLKDDTLRVVAYSLDGKTIDKGAHALMQMLPGMQLVKASFSDAHAVPMELKGDYMPTANEVIAPISDTKAIYNYPNPAAGSTTFCYTLNEAAQKVEIQLFASNGAMMARLQGLSAEQGRHEETVNLPFASGVYYYRLVVDGKQVIATNTLIIK